MKKFLIIILFWAILYQLTGAQKPIEDDFFVFEPDIRLFTVFAFMNAAGYDHDWNPKMHPVRIELRYFMDSILSEPYKKEIRQYYEKLGGGNFYDYGVYAIHSKNPPDFGMICDTCKIEGLEKFEEFNLVLKEFYHLAQLEKFYQKNYDRMHAINLQYKPFAEIAIQQITSFCRTDPNHFRDHKNGKFYYQQVPLMSHFTAFFNESSGGDYWVVSGPSPGEPGPGAFYHEPLHKIINPIVEQHGDINFKLEILAYIAQEKLKGNYNDVTSVICESFVRTIDRFLYGKYEKLTGDELKKAVEDEYRLGFILSFYLLEKLPEYEVSGKTLREYYPEFISDIDVDFEIKRWNEYMESHKTDDK